MFENPRRGKQARNFTTNVPKILDLKSSSEQMFSRKLSLGAPVHGKDSSIGSLRGILSTVFGILNELKNKHFKKAMFLSI